MMGCWSWGRSKALPSICTSGGFLPSWLLDIDIDQCSMVQCATVSGPELMTGQMAAAGRGAVGAGSQADPQQGL